LNAEQSKRGPGQPYTRVLLEILDPNYDHPATVDEVKFHLRMGADVRAVNENNATALLVASYQKYEDMSDILKLLLDHGADVNVQDKWGYTPLYWACLHGQTKAVRLLLSHGADVNIRDEGDRTPLHAACLSGCAPVIQALLKGGVDVNAQDKYGDTPLHRATAGAYDEAVGILLQAGADPNARNSVHETPLRIAGNSGRIDILAAFISHGALKDGNVTVRDQTGEISMPLDIAIKNSDPDTVEAREAIIDWYREHHPELVMERFCATGPGGTTVGC